MVRPGIEGGAIHNAVCAFFEERGHMTQSNRAAGKVQERRASTTASATASGSRSTRRRASSRVSHELVVGDVIALEPGLYRRGWGGVRVEDLVLVTRRRLRGPDATIPYGLEP